MRSAVLGVVLLASTFTVASAEAPKKHAKHVPGAIVFVVDRSGSMQGPKLEAAKAATVAAVNSLDPTDQVAVVIFDSEALTFVPFQSAANRVKIASKLAMLQSGGGTSFNPGPQSALDILKTSKLTKKHVILLSDGEAPIDGLEDLVKLMRKDNETLSTVGVDGADAAMLTWLADQGGGRMVEVKDLKDLSQAFVKETQIALK